MPQTTIPLGLYLQAEFFSFLLLAIEGRHLPECLQGLGGPSRQDHPTYGLWQPPGGQNQVTVAPNPPPPNTRSSPERLEKDQEPGPKARRTRNPSCLIAGFMEFKLGQALHLGCLQPAQIPDISSSLSRRAFPLPPTLGSLLSLGVVLS